MALLHYYYYCYQYNNHYYYINDTYASKLAMLSITVIQAASEQVSRQKNRADSHSAWTLHYG